MKAWREVVPNTDSELYERAGFGQRVGFGARPAVLVIDVQYRTVGDEPLPIEESIRRHYRTSCGEEGWKAVWNIQRVLGAARACDVPVLYPYVAPKASADAGRTGSKVPSLMEVPKRGYEFVQDIEPSLDDLTIPKRHPSAFFGTALASYLIDMGIDTVLLTGCTTSGCIRATAVDAYSYNFHCGVIDGCVYDRSQLSHAVNMFDIHAKYADIVSVEEANSYLSESRTAAGARS